MKSHPAQTRLAAAVLAALIALPAITKAQGTWDGGGTTNNFTDAANWVGDVAPTTNGLYTFAGTTRLTANNNITLTGADNTLTFDSTAGAFTLTGGSIRMGALNNNSSNEQIISLNLRLQGGRTINTGAAGVRVTTQITSTGTGRTLTKSGSGDLTLTHSGTYALMTYNVSAGRLVVANTTGTFSQGAGITLASGTSLVLGQTATADVTGIISGVGSVRKTGSGASTFSGLNTYSGGTVVEAGTLGITQDFTLSGANGFNLAGAATPVQGTDFGAIAFSGTTLTYGGSLNLNFSGTAVAGSTYDLFNFTSGTSAGAFDSISIGGSYSVSLLNNSGTWTGTNSGLLFTFSQSTGDLAISAVPEPSAFAAIAGVLGLGFAASRRRRAA